MDPQTPRDQFPFTNARVARRWRKLLDERRHSERDRCAKLLLPMPVSAL